MMHVPVIYGPYPYHAADRSFRLRPGIEAPQPCFKTEREAIEWAKQKSDELNKLHGENK